jgi:glycosyltransferase involved in cell wall biosynthesis
MGKKLRIGILYPCDESWTGGIYYIQNLIVALCSIPEVSNYEIFILTQRKIDFLELVKLTAYNKLRFIKFPIQLNRWENLANTLCQCFFSLRCVNKSIKLDFLFPLYRLQSDFGNVGKLYFWIPDFQEKYLPHFFSLDDIELRESIYLSMVHSEHPIVFSSQSALRDFQLYYPNSRNKTCILRFAVVHPNLQYVDIKYIKNKYSIIGDYFISPNQFWQHKNHLVIIEAVRLLRMQGVVIKVVLTGKEFDYRNPNYTHDLKRKVLEYGLTEQIFFLGFIDRHDQLCLLREAISVIQPSLFEGWSTVVEDAKALGQTLIVSDIPVHREQLGEHGNYFDAKDPEDLAKIILSKINNPNSLMKCSLNYNLEIERFGKDFISIVDEALF